MRSVLTFCAQWVAIGLCITVLINAARLETRYMQKYEHVYNTMEREHERQLLYSEILRSQQSWEKAGQAMRIAYFEERALRLKFERQLKRQGLEIYAFLRRLEREHPGIATELLRKMGPTPFPLPPLSQPTPADPRLEPPKPLRPRPSERSVLKKGNRVA